jgi:homoserine O-acetyltransferase/O-succinyltransferase
VNNQLFKYTSPFHFESGSSIKDLTIAYSTYGKPNPAQDNIVWVCHALTANSEAVSWWDGLIGEGKLYDTSKYYVVCANIIGSCYGTSGPLEINSETGMPYYLSFPQFTIRDMVAAHEILRKHLGITKIHTCIGGSLGGQQAMEWAIMNPSLIENLVLLATNAFHSPWGIAFNEAQRMAIEADPTWRNESADAGQAGMAAARATALLSYRNYHTYQHSQSEDDPEKTDDFKASSYQKYQGEKLVKRFNVHSYWYLSKAMDSHNVGRGRGGVEKALKQIKSRTLLIGILTDVLFPIEEQIFLSKNIPGAGYNQIDSLFGHDGFLIETTKIEEGIRAFYKLPAGAIR